MARVSVTTQPVVRTGLNPALTGPTVDGDIIDAGRVALWVDNASAGSVSVTVQATASQDGLDLQNLVVAVPAGERRLIGPFPQRTFGRSTGADAGRVYVDYSAVTSVTRAVIGL
jgi:hypothetical protein